MNYIKHMNWVFDQFSHDHRLNPNHITLYISLFHQWNVARFSRRIYIFKERLMNSAKIRSRTTYHRCIHDLQQWGYIKYYPSKNAFKGSRVEIISPEDFLSTSYGEVKANRIPAGGIDNSKGGERTTQIPSKEQAASVNKQKDQSNKSISPIRGRAFNSRGEDVKEMTHKSSGEDQIVVHRNTRDNQKMNIKKSQHDQQLVSDKNIYPSNKTKNIDIPENESDVLDFFRSMGWKVVEGQKFFHHYQSIGWKKGGRIPLTDWRAAAKHWVIRGRELKAMEIPAVKYKQPDNLQVSKSKHYDKPL